MLLGWSCGEYRVVEVGGRRSPLLPQCCATLRPVPRISSFYGIAIYMYYDDHDPPHFHARYAGASAQVAITGAEVMTSTLPERAQRLVIEWARMRESELLADWELARARRQLKPIAPLE